jgi:hypothetical protein
MPRMSLQLLALLMLAVQLPGQALAQPADDSPRYWFLDRLGARDLVPADWALLRQNIQLALYELTDGESVGWTEPVSEHSGSVRVVSTVKEGDRVCRRLRVSVDADAGSDDGVFELCRSGSTGFWRLTTSTLALHD